MIFLIDRNFKNSLKTIKMQFGLKIVRNTTKIGKEI